MRVGVPTEVKNHEYRVAHYPGRSPRAHPAWTRRACPGGRRASGRRSPMTSSQLPARRSPPAIEEVWGEARADLEGQGADRDRV